MQFENFVGHAIAWFGAIRITAQIKKTNITSAKADALL
jgi:hypothetical protein